MPVAEFDRAAFREYQLAMSRHGETVLEMRISVMELMQVVALIEVGLRSGLLENPRGPTAEASRKFVHDAERMVDKLDRAIGDRIRFGRSS